MEINWGSPIELQCRETGKNVRITTIEQAHYRLQTNWPRDDYARHRTIALIETALECISNIASARRAFLLATQSAGYLNEQIILPIYVPRMAAFVASVD